MTNQIEKLLSRLRSLGHSTELGETYLQATVRRYKAHVAACEHLGLPAQESFERFADEVIDAVSDEVRVSILRDEPMAEAPPAFQQYRQYISPKNDGIEVGRVAPKLQRRETGRPAKARRFSPA